MSGRPPLAARQAVRKDLAARKAADFGGGAQTARLDVEPADYTAFEQRLGAIQKAYSDEDLNALRSMVTPEMASYFAEELAENAKKGLVNKLSDVKFLQGDLSEAWRETRRRLRQRRDALFVA